MRNSPYVRIMSTLFTIFMVAIVVNIFYLNLTGHHLISGKDIETYSEGRGVSESIDYATRGDIYSSDGQLVASSVTSYKMIAILSSSRPGYEDEPAYVVDPYKTAQILAPLIGMPEEEMLVRLSQDAYQVEFGYYGSDISSTLKAQIENVIKENNLYGIEFEEQISRFYRFGDFASYIVGYTKPSSLNKYLLIGEMGIEGSKNELLNGVNGVTTYQVDARGYIIPNGVIKQTSAQDGDDIYLTVDSELQQSMDIQLAQAAQDAGATEAWAALMEAKTGRIVAASNYPSFNPNIMDITYYYDHVINYPYEVGSVMKPMIYASVIEGGAYPYNGTYMSGRFNVMNGNEVSEVIEDHNNGVGWGEISFDEGLYHSSNVAICYLLSEYANKNLTLDYLEKLGMMSESEIDGLYSSKGIKNYGVTQDYYSMGFGQGSTFTVVQLLRAYSVFANGGKTVEPHVIDYILDSETNEKVYSASTTYSDQVFSQETVDYVKELMYGVVNIEGMTGRLYKMDDIQMAGKTGTGEIASSEGGYLRGVYNFTFCGLFPYENPEYIIVIGMSAADSNERGQAMSSFVKYMARSAMAKLEYIGSEETTVSQAVIDSYVNQSLSYTTTQLERLGFKTEIIGNGSTVLKQYPDAYSSVSTTSKVFLFTDGASITMPDMEGWSRKEASIFALLSGYEVVIDGNGTIIQQNIRAGTTLEPGTIIEVECINLEPEEPENSDEEPNQNNA